MSAVPDESEGVAMRMKERSMVKAYALQVENGFEVVWTDDWHAMPEFVPEDMISEFINFCLAPNGAYVEDVVIILAPVYEHIREQED